MINYNLNDGQSSRENSFDEEGNILRVGNVLIFFFLMCEMRLVFGLRGKRRK